MAPQRGQPFGVALDRFVRSTPIWLASDATHASTSPNSCTCWSRRALAHRLGQLADLFGQPRDGGRHASGPVTIAEGALDDGLQLGEVHRRGP